MLIYNFKIILLKLIKNSTTISISLNITQSNFKIMNIKIKIHSVIRNFKIYKFNSNIILIQIFKNYNICKNKKLINFNTKNCNNKIQVLYLKIMKWTNKHIKYKLLIIRSNKQLAIYNKFQIYRTKLSQIIKLMIKILFLIACME